MIMNLINYWYQKYLQEKNENKELLSQLLKLTQELAECTKENKQEQAEVDLEKEFDKCCENYTFDDECEVYTAKHFFELGFKAREKR